MSATGNGGIQWPDVGQIRIAIRRGGIPNCRAAIDIAGVCVDDIRAEADGMAEDFELITTE